MQDDWAEADRRDALAEAEMNARSEEQSSTPGTPRDAELTFATPIRAPLSLEDSERNSRANASSTAEAPSPAEAPRKVRFALGASGVPGALTTS